MSRSDLQLQIRAQGFAAHRHSFRCEYGISAEVCFIKTKTPNNLLIIRLTPHMGIFGKSEYDKQLVESARQLAVSKAQQEEFARQMALSKMQAEEAQRQLELARRHQEHTDRQQRETAEVMERTRQHQERYAKLLDTWEAQARRFEAILTKWEQGGS